MERIASIFFCLSLVIYHMLRLFKIKKSTCIKAHIVLGSISILSMICELILRIGQEGFVKYIGFNVIMITIAITGIWMKRNYKLYKKLHVIFTFLFFIYLPIAIKFMQ